MSTTRRSFGSAAAFTALSYQRILGANGRLQMGYIGLGNRGDQVHDGFLEHGDQVTVAICDLRDDYLDFAAKKSRATPERYKDYRKLLENKDVEAVAIATPDHWHALQFVDACRAGKDVYVEKPLSLTVFEGRRMVQVAEETKRVTQVGIQRRSAKYLQEAVQLCREGYIGKIVEARGFHLSNEWPNGLGLQGKNDKPMSEADWEQWLGPAPKVPYDRNRAFYNFRWFFNYSGGQLTNFGVHYMDMLRWCIGQDTPKAVTVMGGRYAGIKDNREIPDTLEALWEFDGCMVVFSQSNANAGLMAPGGPDMEVRGTKGTLYLWSNRWEIVPERVTEQLNGQRTPLDRVTERSYGPSRKPSIEPKTLKGSIDTAFHARNFLDCVKSRQKCNCDILIGHYSTAATLIANIALKTRSYLEWDGKAEKFTNNAAANKLLHYSYRAPYKLG